MLFFPCLHQLQSLEKGLKTSSEVGGGGDLMKRWFPVPEEDVQYCRLRFLICQLPPSLSGLSGTSHNHHAPPLHTRQLNRL